MGPIHVKTAEAALLKNLHTVAFDRDLALMGLGPLAQQPFGIVLANHDDVQWFARAEIAYGHLV